MNNIEFGKFGEDEAVAFLVKAGLYILDRNYKCSCGEIDIVAKEGRTIVFIEVKSRRSDIYGLPGDVIDNKKKMRMRRCAYEYIREKGLKHAKLRVDVLEIMINHIKDIF